MRSALDMKKYVFVYILVTAILGDYYVRSDMFTEFFEGKKVPRVHINGSTGYDISSIPHQANFRGSVVRMPRYANSPTYWSPFWNTGFGFQARNPVPGAGPNNYNPYFAVQNQNAMLLHQQSLQNSILSKDKVNLPLQSLSAPTQSNVPVKEEASKMSESQTNSKTTIDVTSSWTSHDLRSVEDTKPLNHAPCSTRMRDGKNVCYPDVMYIGTSKSGTTSIAHYLNFHPMVKNILSNDMVASKHSKEGHFWELEKGSVQGEYNITAEPLSELWIAQVKEAYLSAQDGFDPGLDPRPVLIEYTPNYLVLDHVPAMLSKMDYKMKFIISLREPVNRTLSSWKFKTRENYTRLKGKIDDPTFNQSMTWGMMQGKCLSDCFKWHKNGMKSCSIETCRKKFDYRSDGRGGGYSYCAHVIKSMYAYQIMMWRSHHAKKKFFIFTIEEFERNPVGTLERLLDFLGLPLYDPNGKVGYPNREYLLKLLAEKENKTPTQAAIMKMITPDVIARLQTFFKPHNAILKKVLGWDPGYPTDEKTLDDKLDEMLAASNHDN